MKKLSWFDKVFFVVNIVFALFLLLSTFSPAIEPQKAKFIYLFGLAYPAFLLLNILFILYWIKKKKRHFILSVAVILFGLSNLSTFFATNFSSKKTPEPEFSIMSFNVRLFDKYNWLNTQGINDSIFKYIESKSPDIVAFQEFINIDEVGYHYIKRMQAMGYRYYDLEPKNKKNKEKKYFGLATFSKYKTVAEGVAYQYKGPKGYLKKSVCIYTDIEIDNKIIRVYNTHLKSLGFGKDDYHFVENFTENNKDEAVEKSKSIASKVLQAAYKRAEEIKAIEQHINESEYPVIVVGDFNEPPYTYSYKQITTNLNDAFLDHGFGLGTTYDGISTLPGLRLDFMLYSPSLISSNFVVGTSGLSDHRPLLGWYSFAE